MFRARRLLLLLVVTALGCTPEANVGDVRGSHLIASLKDAASPDASVEASADASSAQPDAAQSLRQDAGPRSLIQMGMNPVRADDEALADLDVVAFGSKVTTVVHRFGSDVAIEDSIERARWFREQGLSVLFALDVVAGASDEGLDLDERSTWVNSAFDSLFGAEFDVAAVVLGEALDLTLQHSSDSARRRFAAAVAEWLRYASEHGGRAVETRLGVHTRAAAWLEPTPELEAWLEWSTISAVSWHGLNEQGLALSVTRATQALEDAIAAADARLPGVWIRELCYPSAIDAQSHPSQQAEVYDEVWRRFALEPERQPFVAISALFDPPGAECERFAATYALGPGAAEALCSIGLKDESGEARPAFTSVITGMATLGQP